MIKTLVHFELKDGTVITHDATDSGLSHEQLMKKTAEAILFAWVTGHKGISVGDSLIDFDEIEEYYVQTRLYE